jgi:hypothetical protein
MTDYPNREHANADKNARQQAIAALDDIARDAEILRRRLAAGSYTDVSDGTTLAAKAGEVGRRLAVIATLREVREWDAADKAETGSS